jgi:hypothetical protein
MIIVEDGMLRYKKNRIVSDVQKCHFDLNDIERRYQEGCYTMEEKYQYLALLGYSMDGLMEKALQDKAMEEFQ